jgi:Leucine-rich repeat (LRR) protein
MTELRWLGLNYNSITDLKPLRGLKQLKALMVKGNPRLDDLEVEELEELLPNCKIEY